ncbi:HupE/UreJ family protein [Ovoidimarina sediminis]|uniref:HupE/UreJ family protein n=1 Tax=Ovoidimarina sediminis TaxID=3079856 RepID=UPI00290DBA02|nr:HupE/UreJ family protein [Rhodophyticola sp. MJ-SS7]MDU8944347.1 HupE/UreJ family protein [Rhodophyticola sp. MJ-SS7]
MKKALVLLFVVFGTLMPAGLTFGHALEPGYLSIEQAEGGDFRIFWRRPDVGGAPMLLDLELPENCSPRQALPPRFDGRAWISTFSSECVDGLGGGRITIHGLEATRTDVLVRLSVSSGTTLTERLTPDRVMMVVPTRHDLISVFASYFGLGFEHILEGWDHLLFVFALLLLIRDSWRLVGAVTAFTVSHSITLAGATLGWLSVPSAPVEATIALSIVFLASELAQATPGRHRLSERFPWLITFSFGLLHGLGFAGALAEIGLPSGEVPLALLAFNLGVEAGQLAFIAVILAVGWLGNAIPRVNRFMLNATTRTGAAYVIGCAASFWLIERIAQV